MSVTQILVLPAGDEEIQARSVDKDHICIETVEVARNISQTIDEDGIPLRASGLRRHVTFLVLRSDFVAWAEAVKQGK
jgi:hypothetical protein